jgi:excisionase family DNA binding protein
MATNAVQLKEADSVQRLAFGIAEAAQSIGCSKGHIRNLILRRELPSAKVGRRRVVRAEDLEAYLRSQVAEQSTDSVV